MRFKFSDAKCIAYLFRAVRRCMLSRREVLVGSTMDTKKVENNSKYQKEIDRYFSIIYHNPKRIQDNDVQPPEEERKQSQPEMTNPKSSQQLERYHFRERSHSVTQDRSHHTVAQKRSHSETQASTTTECRKVSFSFASKYEEGRTGTIVAVSTSFSSRCTGHVHVSVLKITL